MKIIKLLGSRQLSCLRALAEHGSYHDRCGWIWSTPTTTRQILDTLVARGLAQRSSDEKPVYTITPQGHEAAERSK